ncbi:MAG: lysylphosphatidylglycerol synthase transmembrane domain-containing protein, partial [Gemmatimonadales bacterium]
YVAVLLYGDDGAGFVRSLGGIHWSWVLVGVALASMDWLGGGLRLWILAREVHERPPFWGMVIAGGMGAWGAYVTPLQAGASPMMVYAMKRAGVPVAKAMTITLMSFIATVIFFALSGPLALVLGAGKSLGGRGDVLGLSLLDLFKGSMGIFAFLGVLLLVVLIAPKFISALVHRLAGALGNRSARVAARLGSLHAGIDTAHASMKTFNTPRGWLALFWATIVSGPSHANKLLAGYVALRVVGIEAQFVDVLLLQTLITFLLYFAPTPGASGIAEVLSAAVMSLYLPRELTPLYTLVWRCILSWFTIAFGFMVFSAWVRSGVKEIEVEST